MYAVLQVFRRSLKDGCNVLDGGDFLDGGSVDLGSKKRGSDLRDEDEAVFWFHGHDLSL